MDVKLLESPTSLLLSFAHELANLSSEGCPSSRTFPTHRLQGLLCQFAPQPVPPTLPLFTVPFPEAPSLLPLLLVDLVLQFLFLLLQLRQPLSRSWIQCTW